MGGIGILRIGRFSKDHVLGDTDSREVACADLDDDWDAMKGPSNMACSTFFIELPCTTQGQFSGGCEENGAKLVTLQIVPFDLVQKVANNDLACCLSTGEEILDLVCWSCKKLCVAQTPRHDVSGFSYLCLPEISTSSGKSAEDNGHRVKVKMAARAATMARAEAPKGRAGETLRSACEL